MADVSNSEDILDTRDVIARYEELENERQDLLDAVTDAEGDETEPPFVALAAAKAALAEWDELNAKEFGDLHEFLNELKDGGGGNEQWKGDWYPVTLVRDSYWKDYAQGYAEEVGESDMREARWPFNCIDWDKAADELQMDYSSAEFDGVTYWFS